MQIIDCEQGSPRWLMVRRGRPTASRFGDIVTSQGKRTTSTSRKNYMLELLAERITGRGSEHFVSQAMERGTRLEPQARAWYEMETGATVQQIGFAYHGSGRCGASPDGLVGDDSGIEIKCPGAKAHLTTLLSGRVPTQYIAQVQGCMWVTGRQTWDFVSYTDEPNMPSIVIPCKRDNAMMEAFDQHIIDFCDELDESEAAIRRQFGLPSAEDQDIEGASADWCPWPEGSEQ